MATPTTMVTSPIVTSFDLPKPVANETVGQVVAAHPFLFRAFLRIPVRHCPMSDGNYSDKPCIPTTAVLDACAIVTGNYNGNGHLFCDREGQSPVPSSLLEPGRYFYVVGHDPSLNYLLFASFDVWVPPPRCDPPDGPTSTLPAEVPRWDKHTFFFIPFNGSLVLYFIEPLADLYSTQYHFGKPSFPERVDPYLLFIRFAMAIFTLREKTANELPHPRQTMVALKGGGTTRRRRAGPSVGGQLQTMEKPDDATMEEQDDDMEEVMSGEGGHRDDVSELAELEDGPKLLVKIFEDDGLELPPDLAAAFIPRDEKIEAAKIAWFKANPQIRQCSEATTGVASGIHFE
ncbi:hypothetical protein NLJ89_g142 [Agrocybe chaxingu]|uniref:Uncharacterized protein n=1 Tax=Agrocybe chaxingu TaxID=84603 RepID=A0A9W8TGS8_9AGAR|nr:hypothetical protein NLJ89_g142 [Agrocybe chaxingu]